MAKLTIKKKTAPGKAPEAPATPAAPAKAGAKGINWAYYIVPPLLILAVFQYCRTHARRAAAPAQPAAAAAPAQPAPAVPAAEPAPAAVETPAVEQTADDTDFAPETEQPQEEE